MDGFIEGRLGDIVGTMKLSVSLSVLFRQFSLFREYIPQVPGNGVGKDPTV